MQYFSEYIYSAIVQLFASVVNYIIQEVKYFGIF